MMPKKHLKNLTLIHDKNSQQIKNINVKYKKNIQNKIFS